MKEEKKVESKEIVVLDEGIDEEIMPHGGACCWGPMFAFRS